jgi:hypothetical protein
MRGQFHPSPSTAPSTPPPHRPAGVEGSTGAQALSGFNNLLADARSLLRGGSGGLVTSFGTSRVAGGNTQATRAASVATTCERSVQAAACPSG